MLYLIISEFVDKMPLFILIRGPGIGKTTTVIRLVEMLKHRGVSIGGIVSREIRKNSVRIGFEFVDINSNETVVLASIMDVGPRFGKYNVNIKGCKFAVQVLQEALLNADIIICDELGPMEFKSKEFINCVRSMLGLDKWIIAVVHKKLKHPIVDRFREKADFMINLDIQNRDKVPHLFLDRLE